MKICPKCQKTYSDDNLNFCLDDGTVLNQSGAGNMPDTVLLNQPRATIAPQQQFPTTQQQPQGWNTAPQQQYATPPKKSSKTWIWVLLVLGAVILLCGGGGIAGLIYLGSLADNKNIAVNTSTNSSNTKTGGPFSGNKSTTPTNSTNSTTSPTSSRTTVTKLDLDEWVRPNSPYGITEFVNGELTIASKQKRFYYVLAATDEFKTQNADTVVTLRNVDDAASSLGYGLVFHSNTTPLQQGYAFLIDTQKKKYHVVHHVPAAEKNVISWTKSDAIKGGSEPNTLEVRDQTDKIELYINGTLVNTIKNVYGYSGGVVGLYSGDAVKIAFKDLEIRK